MRVKQIHCKVETPMRPAQLTGSHAEGTLQVGEASLNEMLGLVAGQSSTSLHVELLPQNTVLLRYGMLHARAQLPSSFEPSSSPQITVVLASLVVAWGLKATVHQPFLHIHGRRVTIDWAAVPAFAGWRDLWRYLQRLTFETAPGVLRVHFAVMVTEEIAPETSYA